MKYLYLFLCLFLLSCGAAGSSDSAPVVTDTAITAEKSVKFLWRESRYDPSLQDTISVLVLDEDYCKTIPDAERAALGYTATFTGNECDWDGDYTEDRSNLKCKIIAALGLGYQCSEAHLGFLRQWFSTDNKVLATLTPENCPTTPDGASVQESFDEITLRTEKDYIIVSYQVSGYDMRAGEIWNWSGSTSYQHYEGGLQLIDATRSATTRRSMYSEQ